MLERVFLAMTKRLFGKGLVDKPANFFKLQLCSVTTNIRLALLECFGPKNALGISSFFWLWSVTEIQNSRTMPPLKFKPSASAELFNF